MKIIIIYLRLFQNTHQNASIVKRFQTFLHKNYPIASVYLYKMVFLKFLYKKMIILKILYKKIIIFAVFEIQNLIQIYTITHQIASFKLFFLWWGGGGHAPKPPNKVGCIISHNVIPSCLNMDLRPALSRTLVGHGLYLT